MTTDPRAEWKKLTKDVLLGMGFAGGQLRIESVGKPTTRCEIAEIDEDDGLLEVLFGWSARNYSARWYFVPIPCLFLTPSHCLYKEGVGADLGVIMVDRPQLHEMWTFYPKGHKTNIAREDVKSPPQTV